MNFIKNNNKFKFLLVIILTIFNVKSFKRELVGGLTTLGSIGTAYLGKYLYDKKSDINNYLKNTGIIIKDSIKKSKNETTKYLKDAGSSIKESIIESKDETTAYISEKKNSLSEKKNYYLFVAKNPFIDKKSNYYKKELLFNINTKKKEENITEEQFKFLKIIFENKNFIIFNKDLYKKIIEFLEKLLNKTRNKNQFELYENFKKEILKVNETKVFNEKVFNEIKAIEDYNGDEKMKKIFPE